MGDECLNCLECSYLKRQEEKNKNGLETTEFHCGLKGGCIIWLGFDKTLSGKGEGILNPPWCPLRERQ